MGTVSPLPHQDFLTALAGQDRESSSQPMQILFYFVLAVHVIVCVVMIFVVLLQQGRSADLAGAFGGQGSQTAFGPRAAANVLTRLTTWLAVTFMITSLTLTALYQRSTGSHSVLEGTKPAPISAPASTPAKPAK
ncbi:MAG: preprotein translocase subunit SecG [Terracidiphilus sp.]